MHFPCSSGWSYFICSIRTLTRLPHYDDYLNKLRTITHSAALIILIKNPIPGKTKTRLAATVGNEMALKMYGALTAWTRDQALGLGPEVRLYLYYSDFSPEADEWPADRFTKRVQEGNDLGARMQHALTGAFDEGHQRAIIIGSDCPGITTEYLQASFSSLSSHDVVIGPAMDGGYTLIGTKRINADLFTGIAWSTETVFEETVSLVKRQAYKLSEQLPLSDVDYIEDWNSYGWPLPT